MITRERLSRLDHGIGTVVATQGELHRARERDRELFRRAVLAEVEETGSLYLPAGMLRLAGRYHLAPQDADDEIDALAAAGLLQLDAARAFATAPEPIGLPTRSFGAERDKEGVAHGRTA